MGQVRRGCATIPLTSRVLSHAREGHALNAALSRELGINAKTGAK
jgi:hypothetical protein